MNILRKHVREVKLSDVLVPPALSFKVPSVDKYDGLEVITKGSEEDVPVYVQMHVSDTRQWLSFLKDILIEEHANANGGLALFVDCAFQLGSTSLRNTFLNEVFNEFGGESSDQSLFNRVIVWNDISTLNEINAKLSSLVANIDEERLDYGLDYVVISNLSVFYWQMRESNDYSDLVAFHEVCKEVSRTYRCNVISALSFLEGMR
ncbi:DEKNAAE102112 [Brettanomyces naardenensis]|uniref:DEKNAAE102112 n=1 Tax=Brettanomyces naardenensis TaxID=13370 RepID=A0A448YJM6_BRENA|nr:DEKNAAE102112 [Brettanomyces naardenensis]